MSGPVSRRRASGLLTGIAACVLAVAVGCTSTAPSSSSSTSSTSAVPASSSAVSGSASTASSAVAPPGSTSTGSGSVRTTSSGAAATTSGAAATRIAGSSSTGSASTRSSSGHATSSSASKPAAPATTPVPPTNGGNITQTVSTVPITTKPAVPLTSPVNVTTGVQLRITSVKAVTVTAQGPGQFSGPAVAITVTIKNSTGSAIDTSSVAVNVLDSAAQAAPPVDGSPAAPFGGDLAAGQQSSGVYVFTVAKDRRDPITVDVNYSSGTPVVLFKGNAG